LPVYLAPSPTVHDLTVSCPNCGQIIAYWPGLHIDPGTKRVFCKHCKHAWDVTLRALTIRERYREPSTITHVTVFEVPGGVQEDQAWQSPRVRVVKRRRKGAARKAAPAARVTPAPRAAKAKKPARARKQPPAPRRPGRPGARPRRR